MGVNLSKNEKVSLSKVSNGALNKVFMGLGWDPVKKGGGFFKSMFSGDEGNIDLDASCLLFDADKNILDTVWFRQLKSKDGSIRHSGDNLTGDGDGDDEVIYLDLASVPSSVKSIVFVVSSFRGQTFDKIEQCACRLVNADSNSELVRYVLSGKNKYTAQIMAKLSRDNGEWLMQAIGEPANGSTVNQLVDDAKRFA